MSTRPNTDPQAAGLWPVAIVGAGPVGLALAVGLARCGVRSVVLEKKSGTSQTSKAPGIHVRTREVLCQWGIEQEFIEAGRLLSSLTVHSVEGRRPLLSLDFRELADEADRPGLLILEQSRTEELLLAAARASALCEIRFNSEVVAAEQDDDSARLTIRDSRGEQIVAAPYVVGCDGASSFVRQALGLSFGGLTYPLRPLLADVRLPASFDELPWPRAHNGRRRYSFAVQLPAGLWRIVSIDRGAPDDRGGLAEPDDAEVRQRTAELLGREAADSAEVIWASRFRIHLRSSPKFRVGRVFLAGDAAHVHSPAAGFGMNGGIQDAHNLAWKLAAVLRGGARPPGAEAANWGAWQVDVERLLDSYDVERRDVIVDRVSRYTDLLTRFMLGSPRLFRSLAFAGLRLALRWPSRRRRALRRTTMIDLGYAQSPLLKSDDELAGQRLPNPLLRSPTGEEQRLYALLPYGPLWIAISDRPEACSAPLGLPVLRIGPGAWQDPSGLLQCMLKPEHGWLLIRPDACLAWGRPSQASVDELSDAAAFALGMRAGDLPRQ